MPNENTDVTVFLKREAFVDSVTRIEGKYKDINDEGVAVTTRSGDILLVPLQSVAFIRFDIDEED